MRTHFIDPDFRRTPNTPRYCCVCHRDLSVKTAAAVVRLDPEGVNALHRDDAAMTPGAYQLVGPECRLRIPDEFILAIETPRK